MPDSDHSHPDDPNKSGTKLKATMPHSKDTATQFTVEQGTHEHRALLEQVPVTHSHEDQPERRRTSPGMTTVINPPPQSGGLPGLWGVAYQATGITIIFGAFMWMMYTGRADRREEDARAREDRINNQSQTQAAFASLATTLTTMTTRNDARDVRIDAMLEESRQSRQEMRQNQHEMKLNQQEMLTVLKAILAKYGKPIDQEESTAAPMPRAKVGSG